MHYMGSIYRFYARCQVKGKSAENPPTESGSAFQLAQLADERISRMITDFVSLGSVAASMFVTGESEKGGTKNPFEFEELDHVYLCFIFSMFSFWGGFKAKVCALGEFC
ncbi:hypothetical protein RJT34_21816 [Clitoria ternatea]|uniref:Uncharacterized protein n=1 Tax=Clitoria ternatea TaxID=43366 RepID=A0AAN9IV60_CLITE